MMFLVCSYEKLVGGAYMGELFRLTLVDLVQTGLLLNGKMSDNLMVKGNVITSDMSRIERDYMNWCEKHNDFLENIQLNDCDEVRYLLNGLGYNNTDITSDDCRVIIYVSLLISNRTALLNAIGMFFFVL